MPLARLPGLRNFIERIYFLSPTGQKQAAVELIRTLESFLQPIPPGSLVDRTVVDDIHHDVDLVVELPSDHRWMILEGCRQGAHITAHCFTVKRMRQAGSLAAQRVHAHSRLELDQHVRMLCYEPRRRIVRTRAQNGL